MWASGQGALHVASTSPVSVAKAMSGVFFASRRSAPSGLPACASVPNAPMRSSTSWYARPRRAPKRRSTASVSSSAPASVAPGAQGSAEGVDGRLVVRGGEDRIGRAVEDRVLDVGELARRRDHDRIIELIEQASSRVLVGVGQRDHPLGGVQQQVAGEDRRPCRRAARSRRHPRRARRRGRGTRPRCSGCRGERCRGR